MKKRLSLLLAIFLIFSMVAVPSAAASYEILKIGLYYGTNALSAANLQNVSEQATGYQLGYYDTSRNFIPLYSTNEMYITVVKDKNMYIGDGKVFYDSLPSSYNTVIGAYHLQLDTVASSLDEALALISTLSNAGLSAFVAYTAEGYRVRVGNYTSSVEAAAIAPQVSAAVGLTASAVGESRSCYTVTVTETNTILFEFDMGGQALGIEPNSDETWFKNQTYYGGFEYRRASGDDITVVNVVSMDDYIKGVIPYEMSPSWPIEALKAQALCAKSYAVTCIGKHNSQGFDLCNTTDCQVYYGTKTATDNSDSAVEAVSGLYVLYNGEVAETYYHASSGGWTEDAKNIWGTDIPYLKAVEDTYLTELRPYSFSITLSEVTSILQGKGYDVTDIIDFYVSEYTSAGNVREITFVQSNGETLVFSGERARTCLNTSSSTKRINSHRYTVSTDAQLYVNGTVPDKAIGQYYAIGGDGSTSVLSGSQLYAVNGNKTTSQIDMSGSGSGQYVISGTGSGHNIGMSQCGARDMANQGFTYDQIIQFYFTGVQVGPAN